MSGIPIKGTARGTAEQAYTKAKARGAKRLDFTRDYFTALYADAEARGINADVLVAQWDLETGAGASAAWVDDGNPAGIAMFDDGSTWGLTFSPQKAARAHVTHMAAYLGMNLPADWIATDARWQAVKDAGYFGIAQTTDDLGNGRWATDPQYARKLRERYVAYWGEPHTAPPPPKEQPPMSISASFRASIIPAGNRNRPGFLLNTDDRLIGITQHTTGNTNLGATAEMHRIFTHTGGGPERVSFHFVVDDNEIIQLLPLYEGAYHAADGCDNRATDIGCFDTVAIELCVNAGANWAKAKDNLARLYAMLWTGDKRLVGIERVTVVPGRVYTHQQVSDTNKYCPEQILREGSLPTIIAEGKRYAGLTAPAPTPDPAPEEPMMPKLPKGLSIQMVRRLVNPLGVKDPDTGKRAVFEEANEAMIAWLRYSIDAIPAGGDWMGAVPKGGFGPLTSIIRGGDGSRRYSFVGFAYEIPPAKDAA